MVMLVCSGPKPPWMSSMRSPFQAAADSLQAEALLRWVSMTA